jgi:hypothetical protein
MSQNEFLHRPVVLLGLYALVAAALALVVVPTWGWTYWDFGDGNYLYIARRVREGLVLYRDILAPQPPLHTYAGVVAQSIGEALFGSALVGARLYCLLVRIACGFGMLLLAWRAFGCPFRALLAAITYLLLPIGFWWSLGYQSENLEIVFLLFAIYFLLRWTRSWAVLAGVCSGLACQCNMTGVPFLLANALFLAFRLPRLLPFYLAGGLASFGGIGLMAQWLTGGAYFSNVVLNQVGSFPRTDILRAMSGDPTDSFWRYAVRKVTTEAGKVLDLEGGVIAAAMVGAIVMIRQHANEAMTTDRPATLRTEFLCWNFIGGLLSICFVSKGGTVNYIFTLGEPGIALFAGFAFALLLRAAIPSDRASWRTLSIWDTRVFLRVLFALGTLGILWLPAAKNIDLSLREIQVELPESEVLAVRMLIAAHAKPGDIILAPPFYAWLTDTIVAGELAENYLWQIKYLNETFDARQYGNATGDGVAKMKEVGELLAERKVRFVLLDSAQTGRVPEVQDGLRRGGYVRRTEDDVKTRNTLLEVYVLPRE